MKADGQRTYTYYSLNRLVRVFDAGVPVAEFFHDAGGSRILEFVNGDKTQLISDGENLMPSIAMASLLPSMYMTMEWTGRCKLLLKAANTGTTSIWLVHSGC